MGHDLYIWRDNDSRKNTDYYSDNRPTYNVPKLLEKLQLLSAILHKPCVDLYNLPGLITDKHKSLDDLVREINSFKNKMDNNQVKLKGTNNFLNDAICATLARINKMFLYIETITPKDKDITNSHPSNDSECCIDTRLIPTDMWNEIMHKMSYADSLNLSGVNKHLYAVVNTNQYSSAFALVKKGFYTEHEFTLNEIKSAYNFSENASTFLFFKSEDIYRTIFRNKLKELVAFRHPKMNPVHSLRHTNIEAQLYAKQK